MMQAQANALQRRTMHAQSAMLSTAAPFSKDYGSISVPNPNYMPAVCGQAQRPASLARRLASRKAI